MNATQTNPVVYDDRVCLHLQYIAWTAPSTLSRMLGAKKLRATQLHHPKFLYCLARLARNPHLVCRPRSGLQTRVQPACQLGSAVQRQIAGHALEQPVIDAAGIVVLAVALRPLQSRSKRRWRLRVGCSHGK